VHVYVYVYVYVCVCVCRLCMHGYAFIHVRVCVCVCVPCPPPGDLPDSGIKLSSLMSPALADGFFTTSATWAALTFSVTSPNS